MNADEFRKLEELFVKQYQVEKKTIQGPNLYEFKAWLIEKLGETSAKLAAMESKAADKPAVAVPDFEGLVKKLNHVLKMNEDCMTGTGVVYVKDVIAALAAAPSHSQQSAERITESDAREIAWSASYYVGEKYGTVLAAALDGWWPEQGHTLLNRLNTLEPHTDRCPSHESEQPGNPQVVGVGMSDFVPVDLLLKPDLTEADVAEWRAKNHKPTPICSCAECDQIRDARANGKKGV